MTWIYNSCNFIGYNFKYFNYADFMGMPIYEFEAHLEQAKEFDQRNREALERAKRRR